VLFLVHMRVRPPLFPHMDITVTALARHPSAIAESEERRAS
jgi:muconolactone delta-isomerase